MTQARSSSDVPDRNARDLTPLARCVWRGAAAVGLAVACLAAAAIGPVAAQSRSDAAQRRVAPGNLVGHGGPVKAIQVSEDGTRALTGSFDYSAILWDITVEPPKQLLRLADHNAAVNAVAFVNGTQRALTAGDDSLVRLWDLSTGKLVHTFQGHDAGSKIVGLRVARDMLLLGPAKVVDTWAVSAGWDRTARLWNLETLSPGPVLRDHSGPVNAAVFVAIDSRSGEAKVSSHVLTGSYDGEVRLFKLSTGELSRTVAKFGQSVNALQRLAISDVMRLTRRSGMDGGDDVVAYGTVAGQSGLLDVRRGVVLRELPDADRPILALGDGSRLAGHPDAADQFAIASGDGRIRVFSVSDPKFLEEYRHPFGPVWALSLVPKTADQPQRLYYGGLDDFVTRWQVAPRKPFEDVDTSQYPRRFQRSGKTGDDLIAKGELQFARKCSICHTLTPDGANRAGPTLHNVFGRKIATLAGYSFSPELKTLDIVWNAETIAKLFELGPDKFTPGSKMPLQVMSDKTERDALVAFLAQATK